MIKVNISKSSSTAKLLKPKALFLLFFALFSLALFLPTPAKAASFEAGRIIDDSIFVNKNSMSVADIQNFLNSKVPTCNRWHAGFTGASGTVYSPPWTCLKEYNENPTTKQNNIGQFNPDGSPVVVPGGLSAAQIIWNAAQTYSINPQVILVTLQKETGLITDDWAASWQYRTAMGFGCPDGAPCDAQWFGFANQVAQGTRHFRNFFDGVRSGGFWTPTLPGVNTIGYNPNSACGSSSVNITTRAAAALYSYTPYQPNAAALNNLYGAGDACSAYGNRNFWRDFTGWFGSTLVPSYQWTIVSQGWNRDISNLPRGEKATLTLQAKNTGTANWSNSGSNPIHLGTANPNDRTSAFSTSTWLSNLRPASMQEASVAPGQIGTFAFEIQANAPPGTYNEYFNLVAEGITWLNDIGQYFPIKVVATTYSGQVLQNTYQSSIPASSTSTSIIVIKNTGNVTWYKTSNPVRLGTYSPIDRISPFYAPTWIAQTRPATFVEDSVPPGSNGTFSFDIKIPANNGNYTEIYSLVAEGIAWFNQPITQSFLVTGGIPITKIPIYRHYSPTRGSHFYTSDLNESNIIRSQGWNYEGIAWYASSTSNAKPVYRHYNPSIGRHFYTTDLNESNTIRSQGWNYEGIAWYGSEVSNSIPIYRHYSSTRRAHFYTTSLAESNAIRSQGWNYEGVAYYGIE